MRRLLKNLVRACGLCHGMDTREKPNGDTIECLSCKGKGYL